MALRLEPLNRSHRSLLADFQNPQASLVEYLQRYALRHAEKDLLARTYLALDAGVGTPRLAGYFSLATVSVERASVARLPELDRLPRFPIPGVNLRRNGAGDFRRNGATTTCRNQGFERSQEWLLLTPFATGGGAGGGRGLGLR